MVLESNLYPQTLTVHGDWAVSRAWQVLLSVRTFRLLWLDWCRVAALMLALSLWLTVQAQADGLSIEEGDLLFVAQVGENAITQVTEGVDSLAIDHVAIAHRIGSKDGPLYFIEAIPRLGVVLTPLDSLLSRERGASFLVGRVRDVDAAQSVRHALRYVGRAYDELYQSGDSAIYCSELVQLSYVDQSGSRVFGTIPMTFRDRTGNILDYWTEFYRQHGMAVPEGAPGTNPGELSRRPQVKIMVMQKTCGVCIIQSE